MLIENAFLPLLVGYLLGSIPFGLLITRFAGAGDIRAIGSGNIGATNVLRTGRKGLAALTLLADALKGTVAVWLFLASGENIAALAGLGAFVGHLAPVWLKFKGGKGIAVYVGVLMALTLTGFIAFAVVWLAMAALFRYSSLAALAATIAVPLAMWVLGDHSNFTCGILALMSVLAWIKHHTNIQRLLNGTEGKIGNKR
ncbi:MAG: glycerol-3-phosphate 1-O-acyltransferase PlsY [Rhizobiaceae bacterium]|nr:glycerol-3-phosphate 1-O-acyltransferase PlsY [Rhizobiaceae bacterium]